MLAVWTQITYLVISVGMTIFVAHTLKKNGRIFLLKTFKGDEGITDSINNLLVIGFYLVNIGWVLLWTKYGIKPDTMVSAIEFVTSKVGVVLMVLGCLHLFNLKFLWNLQENEERKMHGERI